MDVAILSAGEGSRLDLNKQLPKSFINIGKFTILERQLHSLLPHIKNGPLNETVNLVLGYGFVGNSSPEATVRELIDVPEEISINCLVLPHWGQTENAASALAVLPCVRDDLLLLCGDVVFTQSLIGNVTDEYEQSCVPESTSAVAAIEGWQDEMTSVRWDENHIVTEYGAIAGHQEAGIFILNKSHFSKAGERWIDGARSEWFPVVFEGVTTRAITVSDNEHGEVNTREQLSEIRRQFV